MLSRRQLLTSATAATVAASWQRTTAQYQPFFFRDLPGVEAIAVRTIQAGGIAAAVAAGLTDATFVVARFADEAQATTAYPVIVDAHEAPPARAFDPMIPISAPPLGSQSAALTTGEATAPQAALIIRTGRVLHVWHGQIYGSRHGWADAPDDATAPLLALLAIAEATVAGDRDPGATLLEALPALDQLPPGFTIASETSATTGGESTPEPS